MAIFDRFKKKDQSVLPDEVKQYYQSEQRQRTGVAVLLGVAALIITVLIAVGLFYGGRYVYRQFSKDDNQTAQQENQNQNEQAENQPATEDNSSAPGEGSGSTPSSSETNNDTSQPSPTPTPAPTPGNTSSPALGDNEPLPHTGDPGM